MVLFYIFLQLVVNLYLNLSIIQFLIEVFRLVVHKLRANQYWAPKK